MDKIKEALTRKVGPLPAWAWGVMLGGSVWVWRAFRGTTLGPTDELSQTIDSGSDLIPSGGGGTGAPPVIVPGYGVPDGPSSPVYVQTPGGAYVEGDPTSVLDILEIIAAGGGLTPPPDPYGYPSQPYQQPAPTPAPTTTTWCAYAVKVGSPIHGTVVATFDHNPSQAERQALAIDYGIRVEVCG